LWARRFPTGGVILAVVPAASFGLPVSRSPGLRAPDPKGESAPVPTFHRRRCHLERARETLQGELAVSSEDEDPPVWPLLIGAVAVGMALATIAFLFLARKRTS
jgi:hypothetical protein